MNKAVILLSGGLDSATCLALAKSQGFSCYALSFSYGQRHGAELEASKQIAKHMNAEEHRIISLDSEQFKNSALTNSSLKVPEYTGSTDIPVTYVPARNTIFLSYALGYAEVIGAFDIFIGVSSIDYSHYPDCRSEYIEAFQQLANLATKVGVEGQLIRIHAPLQRLSKAETIALGIKLGMDYSLTRSCYQLSEKGEACGHCDSCTFRKQGFLQANVSDPTIYKQ